MGFSKKLAVKQNGKTNHLCSTESTDNLQKDLIFLAIILSFSDSFGRCIAVLWLCSGLLKLHYEVDAAWILLFLS